MARALKTIIGALNGTADTDTMRLIDSRTCFRCGGFLVFDDCFDILADTPEVDCRVMRCVQCGEVIDPVILYNRTHHPEPEAKKKNLKWNSDRSIPIPNKLSA